MKAAIYARISSDRSGQELGVARQVEACRELCQREGWTVAWEFVDNDISAFSGARRPQFEAMLQGARDYDVIVVWSTDRLYRRLSDLERIVQALDSVPVVGVKSGRVDLSTADGRLNARLLGSVASHESEKKSERIKAAKQQARDRGEWIGKIPRGYTTGMEVDPLWASKIQDAYKSVLSGSSLNGVAKSWGVYASSVRKLLQSPALAGLTMDHRKGSWTALVSEADFWRMQALLNDRARPDRMSPHKGDPSTLLGSIIRCEHGRALKRNVDCYRIKSVPCGCAISVQTDIADEYVTRWVINRLSQPDARDLFMLPEEGPDMRKLEELKAQRANITALVRAGLPMDDALKDLSDINAEIDRISSQHRPTIDIRDWSDTPARVWSNLNLQARRSVIRELATIVAHPGVAPIAEKLTITPR
jgi:DNA invertase Pin-like site-specific DNA recombinase